MPRFHTPALIVLALCLAAALAGASVDANAHQMIYSLGQAPVAA